MTIKALHDALSEWLDRAGDSEVFCQCASPLGPGAERVMCREVIGIDPPQRAKTKAAGVHYGALVLLASEHVVWSDTRDTEEVKRAWIGRT